MPARYNIGIDEVGRGPLAGPVVIAAACIPTRFVPHSRFRKTKDSKQLSAAERELRVAYFKAHPRVQYVFARVNPRVIDRLNISRAANRAAEKALLRLAKQHNIDLRQATITLDGGLYIKNKETQKRYNARTAPKADERVPVVAYASILAKVHRDRYMARQAKLFPAYGFELHKGYGTFAHRRALKKHGPSPLHRLTFLGK